MLNDPHVVFAGGGALGNLYPGLAIAKHLERMLPKVEISFAGDGRAVERHLVRGEGYNYVAMPGKPAPTGPIEAVRYVTDNVAGFWASRWMVREQQVSLVVGLGGPAGSVMVRAAHWRGIPFVLLEQNAVAAPLTRRLAGAAEAVCGAFDELRPHLPVGAPFALTGIPPRPAFEQLTKRTDFAGEPGELRRLVVIGGAGGARSLNETVPQVLGQLGAELDDWLIVHQTGEGQLTETEQRYQAHGVGALVVSHIDELASLLSETDLVICRSGGTMLAELSLAGAAAVLAPYPDNQGGLQMANAGIFADKTGCPVVDELTTEEGFAKSLLHELRPLLIDSHRRGEIAQKVADLARPDAGRQIAEIVCDTLCGAIRQVAA